jgi:phosphoadenosine phosphosulfate reductase
MNLVTTEAHLPGVESESWSAEEVLEWGLAQFQPRIALASAFGAEGMVLIDMGVRLHGGIRVFTLDTGFFFPETYELIDRIEKHYGIAVERYYPALTPDAQARAFGDGLWSRDPDLCCRLRKVEPLKRALEGLSAWVTAIRRDQTPARAASPKVGWDGEYGLVKLNPLADWTHEQVWAYIRRHNVPYNPLHDRNYPSIGCTHCTRPVQPGEDLRAGRWPGLAKTECGLHVRAVTAPQVAG